MKHYKDYMDGVEASDTLHEKLKHLPQGQRAGHSWRRYAAAAAALVVLVGAAAALRTHNTAVADRPETGLPDITREPAPVPLPNTPGMEMLGGYEVVNGEVAAYYMLPAIRFGTLKTDMDMAIVLPEGAEHRDLSGEELVKLFGSEKNLTAHLNWGGYELSGHEIRESDGSIWLMSISGSRGPLEHFTLDLAPDALPPTCVLYGESEVTDVWGTEVTGSCFEGEKGGSYRVSFLHRGYGFRFDVTGADREECAELVSRLVRFILVGDGVKLTRAEEDFTQETGAEEPIPPIPAPIPTAPPQS